MMNFLEKTLCTLIKAGRFLLYPISSIINKKYEERMRSSLLNKDATIICNTCMGGVISHRLGLQFRSPTVNLYMTNDDFVVFLKDLNTYLNSDVVFPNEIQEETPVGIINGNVVIHFNHYKTKEEALEKWNSRRERIDFDNIFIIAVLHDEDKANMFEFLPEIRCRNYIVLTSQKIVETEHLKYIKRSIIGENKINYLDKDLMNFRKFEKEFNYVDFLNS